MKKFKELSKKDLFEYILKGEDVKYAFRNSHKEDWIEGEFQGYLDKSNFPFVAKIDNKSRKFKYISKIFLEYPFLANDQMKSINVLFPDKKYLAMDSDGKAWLFTTKPTYVRIYGEWKNEELQSEEIKSLFNYAKDAGPENSLIEFR